MDTSPESLCSRVPARPLWPRISLLLVISTPLMPVPVGADQEPLAGLLESEHELSMEFETPHTRWAKPYARGRTRVLNFSPWYQGSTEGREIIELMQRFDLEADAVYYLRGPKRLLGDGNPRPYLDVEAGSKRLLRLLEDHYDVFLLNRVVLKSLPEKIQKKMHQMVLDGAGIVVVSDDGKLPFEKAERAVPGIATGSPAACYTIGKGRGVVLPLRKKLEYAVGWEVELDYQMAEQGRALLWAADRSPRLTLEANLSAAGAERRELPGDRVTLAWDRTLKGAELRVELRRHDGHTRLLGTADASGPLTADFPLPLVREGRYHVVAFLTTPHGIENWVVEPLTVTSESRVDAVVLERDWAEPGETARGSARLAGPVGEQHRVLTRLVDEGGRILVQQASPAQDRASVPFTFSIRPWMPMLLRVEAVLMEGASEVSSATTFLRVTNRHQGRFNFVVWNWPSGDLAPYCMKSFARHGVTAVLQGGSPPLGLAAANLSFVPYASSYRKSSHTVTAMLGPDGIMKGGCTHDPEVMAKWVGSTVERHRDARAHGVLVYSLGDENAVRGSCLSDHCLRAYRSYLKGVYGEIAALNREWDTDYESFDTITLLEDGELPDENAPRWFREFFAQRLQKNRTDNEGSGEKQIVLGDTNDEMRALQAENYPRWYDRQAFQCHNYVEWCKAFKAGFRSIDPRSLTGFEGTDSFTLRRLTTRSRQGGDLDAFVRELEYFGPYRGPANEVVRSIAPPKFPTGNWFGYSMDPERLLARYWDQITNSMNTVQWWRWDNLDGYHGFLSPTFMPFPGGRELLEDTQIVRDGLGTLLMDCHMEDDGIAMLYSMPSTHIAHFDGNRSYGNYNRDHKIWYGALHDSGLQFRYVTDRMLRLGEFDAGHYRVLILPLAFAIGPEEAEVIRAFVRAGGTLLADVRPGLYDGHCKPLEAGVLDDVFGIRRTAKQDAIGLDRLYVDGRINGQAVAMRWGNWRGREIYPQMKVDPTVVVTTGKKLGQAFPIHFWGGLNHPVCIENEFGKGRAVLLNFPIYSAPAQPLIESILASAGVHARIRVRGPDGEPVPGLELTRARNRGIELLALLGTHAGLVTLSLPEEKYVYDLKTHENLGRVGEFSTSVRPNRASFFALLPKPAPRPQLAVKASGAVLGSVLPISVKIPGADGLHSLRIGVTTGAGGDAEWFKLHLLVDENPRVFELPVAFNDPPGTWSIHAVDLYTNETVSEQIAIQRR